jgi:hypothetical protein
MLLNIEAQTRSCPEPRVRMRFMAQTYGAPRAKSRPGLAALAAGFMPESTDQASSPAKKINGTNMVASVLSILGAVPGSASSRHLSYGKLIFCVFKHNDHLAVRRPDDSCSTDKW